MPAEQIAFIHEAKTEVQKKELFAKVRTGQVRVLLGSTAKMGAGTNVTDSDIMAASKLLEISYDDLKVFVDQYHTQKEESRANSLSENEIINRLKTIPGVKGVQTATETNDPNGGLNKPGKYVSAIYFELENVEQSCFDANLDIVGKGTDCGGQIEVYANAEDAKRRDDYLANFDGTFLATFHHLYGTMVIRLSDDLTATEQRNMKDAIISALSK